MSRTARVVFVDGEPIGYFPPTNAENVEYGNTNVKLALDGLSSGKVNKSGDTMTGQLNIDFHDGTTLQDGFSVMSLGNSIPTGTDGNSQGIIDFYAPTGNIVRFYTADNITTRRFVQLPDADGELALKSDIYNRQFLGTINEGQSISIPAGIHNIYLRCDINSYYFSPTYSTVIVPYLEIPFPVGDTWVGTERLTYDSGTKKLTYYSEATVFGSKASTWTTNIAVWYD